MVNLHEHLTIYIYFFPQLDNNIDSLNPPARPPVPSCEVAGLRGLVFVEQWRREEGSEGKTRRSSREAGSRPAAAALAVDAPDSHPSRMRGARRGAAPRQVTPARPQILKRWPATQLADVGGNTRGLMYVTLLLTGLHVKNKSRLKDPS